jgi:hypothetical protein
VNFLNLRLFAIHCLSKVEIGLGELQAVSGGDVSSDRFAVPLWGDRAQCGSLMLTRAQCPCPEGVIAPHRNDC